MTALDVIDGIRSLLCSATSFAPEAVIVGFLIRTPEDAEVAGLVLDRKTLWALDVYMCLPDESTLTYTYICDAGTAEYKAALEYFARGGNNLFH